MNKKEIAEIKKLFTPSHCAITRICGCYVDGEKETIINGDYGFTAVRLKPGVHNVQAVYHIPRLKEGIIGSALGIIVLAGVCLILHLEDRKRGVDKQK